MDSKKIRKVAIYPAIGIARVGNSKEYFLASDVPGVAPHPEGGFKDSDNLFKKQVPLFRIYATYENGEVEEITAGEHIKIDWRVHIANRKAAWYQFNNAMDLGDKSIDSTYRNGGVTGADRQQLIIDPGVRSISGASRQGPEYQFNTGKFFGKEVPLGELRTDGKGRLMVFAGDGKSESKDGIPAITFANNDGWHDDVSDGTVRATVHIGNEVLEADPAMVVCTPPNFGPGLFSVVTMYDVVHDLFVRSGLLPKPEELEFWRDIYPILQRMSCAQWVNDGFFMLFGTNSPSDFENPAYLEILSSNSEEHSQDRENVFRWFRNTNAQKYQPALVPPYYGDLFNDYPAQPHVDLSVTDTQHHMLQLWAEGKFTTGERVTPKPFDKMTAREQIAALLKAPLEECLGGPFHPGIEITWPFRQLIMWDRGELFRLKLLPENQPVSDDYGPILTQDIALGPNGPLDGSGPGSITRWLGVPWQTDEASCLSGYDATLYLPLPSFWATRVPNTVLSMDSFNRASKSWLNTGQRLKHFSYRVDWLRDFSTTYTGRINDMVARWHQLGVIARHTTEPSGEGMLPSEWWVETERKGPKGADPTYLQVLRAERRDEPALLKGEGLLTESVEEKTVLHQGDRQSAPVKRFEL